MSTNKLTRKEISEDPIHEAMLRLFAFLRENGFRIGIIAAVVAVLIFGGGYGTMRYLRARDHQAQTQISRGIDFYYAEVSPDAAADATDPYGGRANPVFASEKAKYEAAIKEFAPIASGYGYGSIKPLARYYLGLSKIQLGQSAEGMKDLEAVTGNSRNRTVGFLAKRVLADSYYRAGDYARAQEVLSALVRDPKCDLPKEELSIQLSHALNAQGKREEAVKTLRDADMQSPSPGMYKQQLLAEMERLQKKSEGASNSEARP